MKSEIGKVFTLPASRREKEIQIQLEEKRIASMNYKKGLIGRVSEAWEILGRLAKDWAEGTTLLKCLENENDEVWNGFILEFVDINGEAKEEDKFKV